MMCKLNHGQNKVPVIVLLADIMPQHVSKHPFCALSLPIALRVIRTGLVVLGAYHLLRGSVPVIEEVASTISDHELGKPCPHST